MKGSEKLENKTFAVEEIAIFIAQQDHLKSNK